MGFLETLKSGETSTLGEVRRKMEDFQRVMESAQDAGQETETEEDGDEDNNNISVEVNDLWSEFKVNDLSTLMLKDKTVWIIKAVHQPVRAGELSI